MYSPSLSLLPVRRGGGNRLLLQPVGANPAPDGWEAYIRNDSGATAPVNVAVICVTSSSVSSVVGTTNVNDGDYGVVSLACPAGQVAVGGGIDPSNVFTEYVTSSGPTWGGNRLLMQPVGANPAPDGWQASIFNFSGTRAPVKAAVICVTSSSVSSVVGTANANDHTFGVVSLACPAGQVAVGGGIDAQGLLEEHVTSSGPTWGGNQLHLQPVGANPAPTVGRQAFSTVCPAAVQRRRDLYASSEFDSGAIYLLAVDREIKTGVPFCTRYGW